MRQNQKNNFSNLHFVNVCHISAPIISIFICAFVQIVLILSINVFKIVQVVNQTTARTRPAAGTWPTASQRLQWDCQPQTTSPWAALWSSSVDSVDSTQVVQVVDLHIISWMIISYHIFSSYIFIYLHALVISSGSGWYWRNLKSSFFGMKLMKRNKMNKPCTCGIQFDPRLSRRGRFSLVTCRFNEFQREKELRWSMVEQWRLRRCAFWFRSFNSCSSFCTLLWSARRKVSS